MWCSLPDPLVTLSLESPAPPPPAAAALPRPWLCSSLPNPDGHGQVSELCHEGHLEKRSEIWPEVSKQGIRFHFLFSALRLGGTGTGGSAGH